MKTFATCVYKRKNRVSHDIRFSKTSYLKTNLLICEIMRYCSYYDGKITNKYNSFQIFFYFFCLI